MEVDVEGVVVLITANRKHLNRESTHQSDNKSHGKNKNAEKERKQQKPAYDSRYRSAEEPQFFAVVTLVASERVAAFLPPCETCSYRINRLFPKAERTARIRKSSRLPRVIERIW